jgi:hypothetical protein
MKHPNMKKEASHQILGEGEQTAVVVLDKELFTARKVLSSTLGFGDVQTIHHNK